VVPHRRLVGKPAEISAQFSPIPAYGPSFDIVLDGSASDLHVQHGLCMAVECTATDRTLVIRCPHCLVVIEFRPMIAYKDGRFICRDCAHTVRPGVTEYKCTCRPCLRQEQGKEN
jgi:hypothetical protein